MKPPTSLGQRGSRASRRRPSDFCRSWCSCFVLVDDSLPPCPCPPRSPKTSLCSHLFLTSPEFLDVLRKSTRFLSFLWGSCLNHLKSPYFEWDSHGIPAVFGPGTVLRGPSGLLRETFLHGQRDGAAATAAAGHLFFLGEHAQHVEYRYV